MDLWQRLKNVFTDVLVDEAEVLERDIRIEATNSALQKAIEQLKQLRETPKDPVHAYGRPFHIEWDFMGIPFSIERQLDAGSDLFLKTIIGYYPLINPTNKPREWSLPLNDDQHAELVESFKKWSADWSADQLTEKIKFIQDKTDD